MQFTQLMSIVQRIEGFEKIEFLSPTNSRFTLVMDSEESVTELIEEVSKSGLSGIAMTRKSKTEIMVSIDDK